MEKMRSCTFHDTTASRRTGGIGRYRCTHCTYPNRGINADVNVLRHPYNTSSNFTLSIVYPTYSFALRWLVVSILPVPSHV